MNSEKVLKHAFTVKINPKSKQKLTLLATREQRQLSNQAAFMLETAINTALPGEIPTPRPIETTIPEADDDAQTPHHAPIGEAIPFLSESDGGPLHFNDDGRLLYANDAFVTRHSDGKIMTWNECVANC